ncbi:hypothetical protein ACHAXT_004113 [Thalassiosira profunda]
MGMTPSLGIASPHPSARQRRLGSSSSHPAKETDLGSPPLPLQFLEASDERNFDPVTHQRNDVPFDPIDGKPPPTSLADGGDAKVTSWEYAPERDEWCLTTEAEGGTASSEEQSSHYSSEWINAQVQRWRADANDYDCAWSPDIATPTEEASPLFRHRAPTYAKASQRVLWSNWTADMVRDPNKSPILFEYDNLVGENVGVFYRVAEEGRLLRALYQYGLVLVTGTPTRTDALPPEVTNEATKQSQSATANTNASAESAILHLAQMIGYHPLRTLYGGGVWSTSSHYDVEGEELADAPAAGSASKADSAYGSTSLPLHTDMTYLSTPPGVQVFLMVQPATAPASGEIPKGQSVFADGFAAAQQLLVEDPEAFRLLVTTPRRYRCVDDEEGWHIEATGTVIETVSGGANEWGPVKSIRHNDLDRLPDLPPYSARGNAESDDFYRKLREAHEAWDDILRRDSNRLVIDLRPGECVLVANQRCLHARYAFETSAFPRVVMGCYVGMDELASKWRKSGIDVI